MKFTRLRIPDLVLIEPVVYGDGRGFFMETYRESEFREAGIDVPFVQDNHSRSRKNVLRGLHLQHPYPQGKLVRVVEGAVWDVAVDLRPGSPSFGKWDGAVLTDENKWQLWIPPGFAHGFVVLSDIAEFVYKCTEYHHPEADFSIRWDDPAIGISWPVSEPLLSERDKHSMTLSDFLSGVQNA
jgi:dTDP-4-dehydrorhamnose 3,5-epimerase